MAGADVNEDFGASFFCAKMRVTKANRAEQAEYETKNARRLMAVAVGEEVFHN